MKRYISGNAAHDVYINADGGCYDSDLCNQHYYDSKPYGVVIEVDNHRVKDGNGEHDEGQCIDNAAPDQVQQDYYQHDDSPGKVKGRNPVCYVEGNPRHGEKMTEDCRSRNDDEDHAGGPGRFKEGRDKALPAQVASYHCKYQCSEGADGPRLGGGEKSPEESPHYQHEEDQRFYESQE